MRREPERDRIDFSSRNTFYRADPYADAANDCTTRVQALAMFCRL